MNCYRFIGAQYAHYPVQLPYHVLNHVLSVPASKYYAWQTD